MYHPGQASDVTLAVAVGAATATPVTLMAFFHNIPPDVLIGAFAGAVMFLLSSAPMPRVKLFGYFCISIIAGILAADGTAKILTAVLGLLSIANVEVSASVGALVAAASAINVILVLKSKAVDRASNSGDAT